MIDDRNRGKGDGGLLDDINRVGHAGELVDPTASNGVCAIDPMKTQGKYDTLRAPLVKGGQGRPDRYSADEPAEVSNGNSIVALIVIACVMVLIGVAARFLWGGGSK